MPLQNDLTKRKGVSKIMRLEMSAKSSSNCLSVNIKYFTTINALNWITITNISLQFSPDTLIT